MGIKIKKWLKRILCGAGFIVLLALSGYLGSRMERSRQNALELQKEYVSDVAVVNMDNGVMVGEEQINYASQLMAFPNDHFSVTGLTDAKTGIGNGTYAAYVVIPETFSESVVSIENDPRRVTLVYQYNDKLDEDAKIQAANDVNSFIVLLNSNIAYMYIDAVLAEFHRVQDDSSTILSNDNMELELLASVNASTLIAAAEPVEEIAVNNEIQPVELTTYTTRNSDLLGSLLLGYSEAVQRGIDDYASIQEENTEVDQAADQLLLAYDTVTQDTAAEQSQFLAEGRDKLTETVGVYNQDVDAQEAELRNIAAGIADMQLQADRESTEGQLHEIIADIRNIDNEILKNHQEQWENAYQELQEEWESFYQDHQKQWESFYQELQPEVDQYFAQKSEERCDALEELIQDVYIQGHNHALEELSGQIDSLKEEDSETIAVNELLDAVEKNKLSAPLEPELEENIEDYKAVISEWLNGISVDWDQLDSTPPEGSGNLPGDGSGEGENPDGEGETGGESGEGGGGEENGPPEPDGDTEKNYEISLTAYDDEEVTDSMVRGTLELFKLEPESEQIDQVLQTYFVDTLSEESERQLGKLSDAKQQFVQSMVNCENRLLDYDPLQYMETAGLDAYLMDIELNTEEMFDTVEQNNLDYMLYSTDMYTSTTEHTAQVRNSLDEANARTTENVEACMDDLISSRESVNGQNTGMLESFTNALRYTRVGSQGNAEVYDYIVNPVMSQINGQAAAAANTAEPVVKKENSARIWLVVVLGIGITFCLAEIAVNVRRQYKKPAEKSEEVF